MLGVPLPSVEMGPFPELLRPPPHFGHTNVHQQQVRSVKYMSTPHLLTKGSFQNLEVAYQACVGPWALWYHLLSKDMWCAHVLHTPDLLLAHICATDMWQKAE